MESNYWKYFEWKFAIADYLLLAILSLPLAFAPFFFVGNSLEFRPVVICLEQIFVTLFLAFNFFDTIHKVKIALLSKEGIIFIAWFLSSICSVFFSDNINLSLLRQAEWLSHIVFAFCVWIFLSKNRWAKNAGYLLFLFGFLFIGADIGLFWCFLDEPAAYPWTNEIPHFSHIRHFSYHCSAATTILFFVGHYYVMRTKNVTRGLLVFYLLLVVTWGWLVWSGGRAAVGVTMLGVTFSAFAFNVRRKAYSLIVFFCSFLTGLFFASCFPVNAKWVGLANAYSRTFEASSLNSLLSGRLFIWRNTLEALAESPFWGLGPDMFRSLGIFNGSISQPHNFIIQFLVEWGIVGTFLFLVLNFLLLKKATLTVVSEIKFGIDCDKVASLTLILNFMLLGLTDGTFYHAIPLMLTGYAYAALLVGGSSGNGSSTDVADGRYCMSRDI